MNKILVVVSFVFVSFLSCTGLTDRQRLANQILSDTNLLKVDNRLSWLVQLHWFLIWSVKYR